MSRALAGDAAVAAARPEPVPLAPLAWILWIPPIEELVFRRGVGRLFRRLAPGLIWPAWFSSLTFALVHAEPTLAHLLAGRVGLPLGPFLLGLGCEAALAASGRLLPAVLLHAACNGTATIFALIDPRWLDWLGFLYG
jgi:membrane protease YdiL (CAAX protease family)